MMSYGFGKEKLRLSNWLDNLVKINDIFMFSLPINFTKCKQLINLVELIEFTYFNNTPL